MYHIQGADNQTRGPVDENTIRHWIAEGRANGMSMAIRQGDPEWQQLARFPEFATALSQAPPPAPPAQGDATGGLIPYKKYPRLGRILHVHPRTAVDVRSVPRRPIRNWGDGARYFRHQEGQRPAGGERKNSRLDRHRGRSGGISGGRDRDHRIPWRDVTL